MGNHALALLRDTTTRISRAAAALLAAIFKGAWYVRCDRCGTTLDKGRRTRWFLTRASADLAGTEAGWKVARDRDDAEICPACLAGPAATWCEPCGLSYGHDPADPDPCCPRCGTWRDGGLPDWWPGPQDTPAGTS